MADNDQNPTDQNPNNTTMNDNSRTAGNGLYNDSAEFVALKQELEETQSKLKEMTGITQHALADLQNFRRRAEEDRAGYITYANAELMNELLPVVENFNKALAHDPKDTEWVKATESIIKQFQQTLEKRNLKPIEALNQPFDPKIHEALS